MMLRLPSQILKFLNDPTRSCVVLIRAWFEGETFTARMIVDPDAAAAIDPDEGSAEVVLTDSVDLLCESLRAVLLQRGR
jgi:hypothetical protein